MRCNQIKSYTGIMKEILENQRPNAFLWAPFVMAAGAALYFSVSTEPNLPFAWLFTIVTFCAATFLRIPIIIRGILLFLFGFCYANAYTAAINTPIMPHDMRDINIVGHVTAIDHTPDKHRIFIRVPTTDLSIKSGGNAIVRVSTESTNLPNIGDEIITRATLFTPSLPDIYGGFDFARWAYFNRITATGYIDNFTITKTGVHTTTNGIRNRIHTRADSMLVDGLVLGYKNTLPADERAIWMAAGVGHIWSISGFHMTLIGGWLFAIFYFIFRCIPPVVRRVPARHVAAICAWVGVTIYLCISGMGVATIRAFLMTTLLMVAAIMGRNAFSLRNVCLVFCAIFLINPYYVMTAGFQLSFSAIFGLVWFWTVVNPKMPNSKILRILCTTILTAIIASLFTAPFIALHFYSVPLYSIIGNLILLPIFSFLIMPLVMAGAILAILDIHFPLHFADIVYNWALGIANHISGLPFATITPAHVSNTAICFIIFGMMCIVFVRTIRIKINYILGTIFILIGTIVVAASPRPVFFATPDHELVGIANNGEILFNKSRASNHYFAFDTWKHLTGNDINTTNDRAKHNHGLYIFDTPKYKIAYMQKFTALQNNLSHLCDDENIDFIVSYLEINGNRCADKILHGGFTIYESGKIIYVPINRRWNSQH